MTQSLIPITPAATALTTIVGLDLGQTSDPTALCVIERRRQSQPIETHYHVRDLRRYKLGTSYPAIVGHVKDVLAKDIKGDAKLVIDQTGVGRAVFDMMVAAGMSPVGITITGMAQTATGHGNEWHVPKADLVSTMQVLLQQGRLKFSSGLKAKQPLINEMRDFRVKVTDSAHETFSAREGKHDDLILSLAIAVWVGEYRITPQIWI